MAFDFFDKDKSGKLSPYEIRIAFGIGFNLEKVKEILKEVDLKNDVLISSDEFKLLMVKVIKNNRSFFNYFLLLNIRI